jgi:hypothetical protein
MLLSVSSSETTAVACLNSYKLSGLREMTNTVLLVSDTTTEIRPVCLLYPDAECAARCSQLDSPFHISERSAVSAGYIVLVLQHNRRMCVCIFQTLFLLFSYLTLIFIY